MAIIRKNKRPKTVTELASKAASDGRVLSLAEAQAFAYKIVATKHAERLNTLTGGATIEERDTWKSQEEMARKYKFNPVLETEAAEFLAGLLTPDEKAAADAAGKQYADVMADMIIAKADYTFELIKVCGGVKRAADDAIASAATVAELEAAMNTWAVDEAAAIAAFLSA